jgi:hypothetical protein
VALTSRTGVLSSSPYSPNLLELDFSHLRAEGVRMLHSPPLKVRRAQHTYSYIARSAILAKKLAELCNGLLLAF